MSDFVRANGHRAHENQALLSERKIEKIRPPEHV